SAAPQSVSAHLFYLPSGFNSVVHTFQRVRRVGVLERDFLPGLFERNRPHLFSPVKLNTLAPPGHKFDVRFRGDGELKRVDHNILDFEDFVRSYIGRDVEENFVVNGRENIKQASLRPLLFDPLMKTIHDDFSLNRRAPLNPRVGGLPFRAVNLPFVPRPNSRKAPLSPSVNHFNVSVTFTKSLVLFNPRGNPRMLLEELTDKAFGLIDGDSQLTGKGFRSRAIHYGQNTHFHHLAVFRTVSALLRREPERFRRGRLIKVFSAPIGIEEDRLLSKVRK